MARTVLCFGDSNTHGSPPATALDAPSARYGRDTRWPTLMAAHLGPDWHVIEEGHPGRTTVHDDPIEGAHRNGLTVLPSMLESHRPIDVVILMLGTNDLKGRFSVNATDIALSLERLIAVIRSFACGPNGANPGILLVSPPPIIETGCLAEMFEGGAAKSHALAPAVAKAAARAGVAFLDAGAHIAVSPVDGIHYEPGAHATLALALAATLHEKFKN
jgi:lysophospholipase L1-like esterase